MSLKKKKKIGTYPLLSKKNCENLNGKIATPSSKVFFSRAPSNKRGLSSGLSL